MSADVHLQFPLVGEPLALDLVNTVVGTPQGDVDLLDEPAALVAWLDAQGERVPQPGRALTQVDLRAVHAIRTQISVAIEHSRLARPNAVEAPLDCGTVPDHDQRQCLHPPMLDAH